MDKGEAYIVREIFGRFADGASCRTIAADLNARRIPSPGATWNRTERRAAGWMGSGIRVILRNERYRGTVHWNASEWRKDHGVLSPGPARLQEPGLNATTSHPRDRILETGGAVLMSSRTHARLNNMRLVRPTAQEFHVVCGCPPIALRQAIGINDLPIGTRCASSCRNSPQRPGKIAAVEGNESGR